MTKLGRPKGSKNRKRGNTDKSNAIAKVIRLQRTLRSLSNQYGKKNLVRLVKEL